MFTFTQFLNNQSFSHQFFNFNSHRFLTIIGCYFDPFVLGDCEVEVRFYRRDGKGYGVQGGMGFPINWIVGFIREQC